MKTLTLHSRKYVLLQYTACDPFFLIIYWLDNCILNDNSQQELKFSLQYHICHRMLLIQYKMSNWF